MSFVFMYLIGSALSMLALHALRRRENYELQFSSSRVELAFYVIGWPFMLIMGFIFGLDRVVGFVHDKIVAYFNKRQQS